MQSLVTFHDSGITAFMILIYKVELCVLREKHGDLCGKKSKQI